MTRALAVETRGLVKRYGRDTAVDGLNLSLPYGTILGLIGPNGAGKTTTLRLLAGLTAPDGGVILLDGRRMDGPGGRDELRHLVGFMPDEFGVYEDMRAWEYLDFFGRCYGLPAATRARLVTELLDLVDLGPKRDAQVDSLSRGMKQRLCLAHALVHDPAILLLDEPASGLDPRARLEMRALLRELGAMGKTILISSHILSEMEEVCDQVAIMDHGRLVAGGDVKALLDGQVSSVRALEIRFAADAQRGAALLRDQPGVSMATDEVEGWDGRWIRFDFSGDEAGQAALLGDLVRAGLPVAGLRPVRQDLEQAFMAATGGGERLGQAGLNSPSPGPHPPPGTGPPR